MMKDISAPTPTPHPVEGGRHDRPQGALFHERRASVFLMVFAILSAGTNLEIITGPVGPAFTQKRTGGEST